MYICQPLTEEEISTPSNLSALGQTHVAPHDSASASCSDQFHRSMQKRCEEQKLSRLRNDSKIQSPDRSQLKADQMEKWHELVPKTSALAIRPRSPTDFGVID